MLLLAAVVSFANVPRGQFLSPAQNRYSCIGIQRK
eukprot:SAG31_NODE_2161_length_6297_cov_1.823169_10_plen_34_part_01